MPTEDQIASSKDSPASRPDRRDGRRRIGVRSVTMAFAALLFPITLGVTSAGADPNSWDGTSFVRGTGPIQTTWYDAELMSLQQPGTQPLGSNDPSCRPSASRPYPIVLVPGTIQTSYAVYARMAPALIADGACVYTFSTGYQYSGLPLAQVGSPHEFVATLSRFVDAVLEHTGADKVDLLGYSQASAIGFNYIKTRGAEKVHHFISFDGTPQGNDFGGLLPLNQSSLYGQFPVRESYDPNGPFLQETTAGGMTVPSVQYTVMRERLVPIIAKDQGLIPGGPNVNTILMEDVCPLDFSGHTAMPYNDIAIRIVRNTFDSAHPGDVSCQVVLPQPPF